MDEFFFSSESEADRAYAAGVGAEHPEREWVLSDRDVWYRNPYFTGIPTGGHPEDGPPPWTPDAGPELLGFNLREVAFHVYGEKRRKERELREAFVPVSDDDIPF